LDYFPALFNLSFFQEVRFCQSDFGDAQVLFFEGRDMVLGPLFSRMSILPSRSYQFIKGRRAGFCRFGRQEKRAGWI
jgi:hypothetical protein